MAVISIKCTDKEKQAFQAYCERKGVTVSGELRALMNKASNHTPSKISINTLHERIKALEAKFEPNPKIKPSALGELITIEQAESLTGYAGSTIRGKIKAVKRRGKKGLYPKSEILDKFGTK